MSKRRSPYPLLLGLIGIAIVSFMVDFSGILKSQILQSPETLASVKLIRQNTDPVQFDVYYDRLTQDLPPDAAVILVNSLVENGGRYISVHQVVDNILLQTGTHEKIVTTSSETIKFRNLQKQKSTKLGTIVTRLRKDEYISLEYDTVVGRTRLTQIDRPVPADFPLEYHTIVNPTSELLYISTPGYHTILSPDEKAYIKAAKIHHGAMLVSDTITTLQPLEGLNSSNVIAQSIELETPPLIIEQNQIVLPHIPGNHLNTLIIRYRSGTQPWDYNYFLLSATKDITLKVPLQHLLDFYTEVEYSFASIGNGIHTFNLEFPYNSLLNENEFPAFYRTKYVSLLPELYKTSNSLNMELTVSIASSPDSIAIGLLTREPLLNLQEVLDKLEQKLPIMIFEDDSETFKTWVSTPDELPYFNLIGKNDQVWSQKITRDNISLVSQLFEQIPLLSSEEIPELEAINEIRGDKLLCFLKTDKGSYSLGTISADVVLTTSCLQSARRAGFNKGTIYPVQYVAELHQLKALKQYEFDESLGSQVPIIKNYDLEKKIVSFNNAFNREKLKIMVSPTPGFEVFATQNATLNNNSFSLPVLASCDTSCYFKAVAVIREDEENVLGYASDTLVFAETALPVLHLCFTNLPLLEKIFDPKELPVQVLRPGLAPIPLNYEESSGCYEFVAEESGEAAEGDEESGLQITSIDEFYVQSDLLPKNSIVFHSNGITNNHIVIPSQRHYLPVTTDSLQQVLTTHLAFEHYHLSGSKPVRQSPELQTSYQVNILGQSDDLMTDLRGNVILHTKNSLPMFLEKLVVTSPLNETLLYPGSAHTLALPNTIRFLASDEVVIQGFQESDRNIILPLPVPERSQIKMFLENVFRPKIEVKQLLSDGIIYHQETGFISLENPAGLISLPVQISLSKPTDVAMFETTFPKTAPPDDIDIASFESELIFEVVPAPNIPNTSILDPIELTRAQLGFEYFEKVPLQGIENTDSFELGEARMLTEECQQMFTFDPQERTITGNPPVESTLEGCYFELSVRYLVKLPYAQMEVTTLRTYRIPLLDNPGSTDVTPQIIQVPINMDGEEVSQVVNMSEPVEEIIETTAEFLPKSSEKELISPIGDLSIVFSPVNQQFVISGNPEGLTGITSRYVQAILQDSGTLVLFEFQFIPVQHQALDLNLVEGFPNDIDVPQILADLDFTEEEIASVTLVTDTLPSPVEVNDDKVVTIFGLPELQEQVFSALLDKQLSTPSPLVEFDQRLAGDNVDASLPNKMRVDFHLKIVEPETVTLPTLTFDSNKNITIDLRNFIPASHVLSSSQVPAFLLPNGYVLTGRTPSEAQEINLLIQDFTDVKNYLLPINITAPEVIPEIPVPEVPAVTDDLKGSADDCFPDLAEQPAEYRDAICLAKQHGIISGSGGRFNPNDPINRAEISKVLVTGPLVIFEFLTSDDIPRLNAAFSFARFPDVPITAWFYGFVETVKEVGIFSGYPDGSFKPANYLIQAEAAKVIVATLLQLQPQSFPSNVLQANTIKGDQWFAPYVRILNQSGGDLADPADIDALSRPITRAQFVYNLLILLDSKAEGISQTLQ